MDSVITTLIILGLILLVSSMGWLIEKFSKANRPGDDNLCVLIKDLVKDNPHWVLLYLFFFAIIQAGFYNILESFDMTEDGISETAAFMSFALVSYAFYQVNKMRQIIKSCRSVIKLSAANDNDFLRKLSLSNPGNYLETRDISLSLILEKQGMTKGFTDKTGPTTMHNLFDRSFMGPKSEHLELAKQEVEDLGNCGGIHWSYVYDDLKLLDSIVIDLLPKNLRDTYPKDIYFLRLNLIEMALPWVAKGEPLILKQSSESDRIINEFCKLALNKFYMHPDHWKYRPNSNYVKQPVSCSLPEIESYLKRTN